MCFFLSDFAHHRDLPSFPTRRSSDLDGPNMVFLNTPGTQDSITLNEQPDDARIGAGGVDHIGFRYERQDRKSTRLNSSHANISYAVFCLKKKKERIVATIKAKDVPHR